MPIDRAMPGLDRDRNPTWAQAADLFTMKAPGQGFPGRIGGVEPMANQAEFEIRWMLVGDQEQRLNEWANGLRQNGFVSVHVSNRADCVRSVTRHRPDIVVMDQTCCEDSFELVRQVLDSAAPRRPHLILACSSQQLPRWIIEGSRYGFDEFLATDITDVELAARARTTAQVVRSNIELATSQEFEEARFRGLLEAAPDAMVIANQDGVIEIVNQQAERMFGYHRSELIGQSIEILVPQALRHRHVEHRRGYSQHAAFRPMGQQLELRSVRKDGSEFPVEISLSPFETPGGLLITAAIRDVTIKKRDHEDLRRIQRRLAEAQRIGQIGSWEWDLAAGTAWWSEELYRMCGVDPATFNPSLASFLQLVVPDDRPLIRHHVQATIKHGKPCSIEYRILRQQSIRVHAFTAELMRDEPSKPLCLQGTVQDITGRRELEISVRRAERLASLGTLAAGIAHEINNPISAAWTAAETAKALKHRPNSEPMMDECLDAISDTVRRCQVIVDNVLRFARQESSEKKPHDINEIVGQAIETTAYYVRAHRSEVQFDRDRDLPPAMINGPEIEQVLVNLIRNAVQSGEASRIRVATRLVGGQVAIRVEDNGRGIPQQDRERIFDPFFTTNQTAEGTGLGLAISHGIVEDNNGTIELDSTVGVGSVFTVLLPAVATRQSA